MLTDGGAISGYCSIGDTDIDTAPASTNRIEMTADRIGRSIKKCVNMGYFWAASVALGVGGAAAGAAPTAGTTVTGWPGTTFSTPSTTTRSPAASPARMTMSLSP